MLSIPLDKNSSSYVPEAIRILGASRKWPVQFVSSDSPDETSIEASVTWSYRSKSISGAEV